MKNLLKGPFGMCAIAAVWAIAYNCGIEPVFVIVGASLCIIAWTKWGL